MANKPKISKQIMYPTSINIPLDKREQLADLLNAHLASAFDLYSQTKQAHWNVKGNDFFQLHLLFDQLAGGVLYFVDTIAERVTALGATAMGTARMASQNSTLREYPATATSGHQHLKNLIERYAAFGASCRAAIDAAAEKYDDQATADLFTEIVRQIDKDLYFLEAHLQAS